MDRDVYESSAGECLSGEVGMIRWAGVEGSVGVVIGTYFPPEVMRGEN